MTARILAVAEVYDVLTSPDSYRIQMTAAEAEDELRRVAGSQLDGRLVWLFATQVLRGGDTRAPRAHRRPRGRAAGPAPRPRRARRAVRDRPARTPSRRAGALVASGSRAARSAAPKASRNAEVAQVDASLEAEDGVADELDEVVERVELRERPAPTRAGRRSGRTCRRRGTAA